MIERSGFTYRREVGFPEAMEALIRGCRITRERDTAWMLPECLEGGADAPPVKAITFTVRAVCATDWVIERPRNEP